MNLSACQFNSGFSWTFHKVIDTLGLPTSKDMLAIFRKVDQDRIRDCDYKVTKRAKVKRKKKRSVKNKLADSFKHVEGVQYASAKFY